MKQRPCSVFVLLVVTLVGCVDAAAHQETAPAATARRATPPPLRVALLIDKTASVAEAAIDDISISSLAPIFHRVADSGGEIAIGFIRARSVEPLTRIYVPAPPTRRPARAMPGNIFAAAGATKAARIQEQQDAAKARAWHADTVARLDSFASRIAPLLAADADAERTDIRSALIRAELFASEPTNYAQKPKNLIILVTDGIDNVNGMPAPSFTGSADLLIVNGAGTVAYLAPLHPVRFESFEAAIRFAVGGNNGQR